tara:strand:+ start:116 stop:466 length:351 start_codon:yes stop_codon:yes gene_type:complete
LENLPKSLNAIGLYDWLQSDVNKPIIIDVREKIELEIANFPFMDIHIPLSNMTLDSVVSELKSYPQQKFVILCHKGIRSYNFGCWLLDNNLAKEVWNLNDGIDGWSKDIDDAIPRY